MRNHTPERKAWLKKQAARSYRGIDAQAHSRRRALAIREELHRKGISMTEFIAIAYPNGLGSQKTIRDLLDTSEARTDSNRVYNYAGRIEALERLARQIRKPPA